MLIARLFGCWYPSWLCIVLLASCLALQQLVLLIAKSDGLCPAACCPAAVFAVAPYNATTDSLPQLKFWLARLLASPPRKQARRPARHANNA